MHDHAGIAAQLERDFFLSALLLEPPANSGAAGERHHLQPRIGDQRASLLVVAGDEIHLARRHAAFDEHLGEQERGERCFQGRLHDQRVARSHAGRNLVRDEIERKIERRDRADDAEGKPAHQPEMPAARCIRVNVEQFTVLPPRLLARHGESDDRSRDFSIRKRVGLPRLGDHRLDKIRAPFFDATRDSRQQVAASMGRLCTRDFKRLVRDLDRLVHRLCVSERNLREFLSGVGIDHRRGAARLAPFGTDEQPRSFCAGRHLLHLLDFAFFDKDFQSFLREIFHQHVRLRALRASSRRAP